MQRHEVQLRGAESWGGGGWGRTASAPPCGRVRVVWRRCPVPARPWGAHRPVVHTAVSTPPLAQRPFRVLVKDVVNQYHAQAKPRR